MADSLPEDHRPDAAPLLLAPREIGLCFQTAGVWELGRKGRIALPVGIDRLVLPCAPGPARAPHHARVTASGDGSGRFDAVVVDVEGRVRLRLEGYAAAPLATLADATRRAPLRDGVG